MNGSEHPSHDAIRRIEENLLHTERTVEDLSGEIAQLHSRMRDLARQLESLERRLIRVINSPPAPDPHTEPDD
ncbi:MAG: SlyX family protein [Phycisphaerales bacterium]